MKTWAKAELDRLLPTEDKESIEMQTMMNDQVMEMVELFCTHGHSGFSASYAISMLTKLLSYRPLTPITGAEEEWGPLDEDSMTQQNQRCTAVFRKSEDNAQAYYIDGKIFSDDGGHSWFTNKESNIDITFPYVPTLPQKVYLNGTGEKSHQILTSKRYKRIMGKE